MDTSVNKPADGAPYAHLPHGPGVYLMRDSAREILYVGKAKDLAKRVACYFKEKGGDHKTTILAPLIRSIDYVACASEREALLWERRLIRKHQPFFNAMWKDDKSYPYVKISLNEDYPRVFLTRRKKRDGALYFGPYPKVTPIRNLLKSLWRLRFFLLRPCDYDFSEAKPLPRKKIQACLYYHTGECPAPCAGRIGKAEYRRIAEETALFFQGKYGELEARWSEEMKAASEVLDFERAAQLRDNVAALRQMGERVRVVELSPAQLEARLAGSRGVTELQQALGLKSPPHHIECFDISHFAGNETVASMVCAQGGEAKRDHYRRFKIKTVAGIDDFGSMNEVVTRRYRRLREEKAPLPDLILIDGGKGQLAAAQRAIREAKVRVPMAALAKRLEEVFLPGKALPVVLPHDSPALHLLQRVRDEAHRFAVSYHTLLRGKKLLGQARR